MGRIAAWALVVLSGCTTGDLIGSGEAVEDVRRVDAFTGVRLAGVGDVDITIADKTLVVVETDENLVERIVTSTEDGVLVIDVRDGPSIVPRSGLRIAVATPSLDEIDLRGAGDIDVGRVESDDFRITLSGAGSIAIDDLATEGLEATLSGAGGIRVAGVATSQFVVLSGAGDYDAADLESATVDVRASGAGSAEVWATDVIDVASSGVGSVSYWGSPEATVSSTGLGTVDARGER
jgi:hypothetical protein